MDREDIPKMVVDALEVVRDSGATNMMARPAVIELVAVEDAAAADWLNTHLDDYMEALYAMGARRSEAQERELAELESLPVRCTACGEPAAAWQSCGACGAALVLPTERIPLQERWAMDECEEKS